MELFLTVNGIGRGHLTRALHAARWLRRAGRRPVIFHQGNYPANLALRQPGLSTPSIRQIPAPDAIARVDQIADYARLSQPAIIIEDTHPAWVPFPPDIVRVLMVRATTIDYLRRINAHASFFSSCLLIDDPKSPVWPYNTAETEEILGFGWRCIGPVFRRARPAGVAQVRERYRISPDEQIFVFSMGGGGQFEGSGDRENFLARASELAPEIRERFPRARLVFVCGELFPQDLHAPDGFEEVRFEPDMPALIATATAAVVRPGFGITWEFISGETPFLAIRGTTREEPVAERSQRLLELGLELPGSLASLTDDAWMQRFRSAARSVNARFTGAPAHAFIEALDAAPSRNPARGYGWRHDESDNMTDIDALASLTDQLRALSGPKRFILRLDDVVAIDEQVSWLAGVCRTLGLTASLEVIPYLSRATLEQLEAADPDGLLDVGQHGYAHLPHRGESGRRGEFVDETLLRRGHRYLRAQFRARFKGGYSAPFDLWPPSVPVAWRAVGGSYVSWIVRKPRGFSVPSVHAGVDPWDWVTGKRRPLTEIGQGILASMRGEGYAGIVLHPQLLQVPSHRALVERLLGAIVDGGCRAASPATIAARPQRVPVF